MNLNKKGVLLLNIGSPESYAVDDVKKYLDEFLMDKDIIDLPFVLRWILVKLLIVPKRTPLSAKKYQRIWADMEEAPFITYSRRFAQGLQEVLGDDYLVLLGMRYSEPRIEKALQTFSTAKVSSILLAPLFPQYAEATTGSSIKEVQRVMRRLKLSIPTAVLPPFFEANAFIKPTARLIQETLRENKPDHYLFSFHGLPESHIRRVPGCQLTEQCCLEEKATQKNCYRAQCFKSVMDITQQLGISKTHWSISFQSRLGRNQWLKPGTYETLELLGKTGKKTVAVICPSFVADCLETMEEMGLEGKEIFQNQGGKGFCLIPCLNDDQEWVTQFSHLIKNRI